MVKIKTIIWGALITVLSTGLVVAGLPNRGHAIAAETGGYPWADALTVNQRTYDWGYPECKQEMQAAGTCQSNISYRDGRAYYQSDPLRYDVRNCTSYVAWRIQKEFGIQLVGWGNANNWVTAALQKHYITDEKPRVGDIAAWPGYYGHVAYVTSVNTDGTVDIDQYNKQGTGEFSKQSRVRAPKYIHITTATVIEAPPKTSTPLKNSAPTTAVQRNTSPVPAVPVLMRNETDTDSTTEYDVIRDSATRHVEVYGIQYRNTDSGFVEVSRSNYQDGNSTWQQTWAVNQLAHSGSQASYRMADYNADGRMDLYQIKYSGTTSNQTEVRIFDGSRRYAELLGSWRTASTVKTNIAVQYAVADYNGDSQLDIYSLATSNDTDSQTVEVLDGAKQFGQVMGTWRAEGSIQQPTMRISIGDDDRDGTPDIYQLQNSERADTPDVYVRRSQDTYRPILKRKE